MPAKPPSSAIKTAGRVVAVLCLAGYFALLAHKAFADVAAVASAHPDDFWKALGRHLLRNLGGA